MVALESASLFRNLNRDELGALRRIAQERRFAAGQVIFREGDPGDGVYVVKDGLVEISGSLGQSERRVFARIEAGGMFRRNGRDRTPPALGFSHGRQRHRHLFHTARRDAASDRTLAGAGVEPVAANQPPPAGVQPAIRARSPQAERLAVVGRFARSIVHDLKKTR